MSCAIVVAAGRSRRMGTQKLLLPFGGATVVAHIVDQILRSVIDRVLVVVGADGSRIEAALAGRPVSFVTNPDPEGDMLSSVRCGLAELPRRCEAILVALGDQPTITAELTDAMVRAFEEAAHGILVPVHRGERGHPILFASRFRDEILTRYDGVGLRGLARAHPDDVAELDVPTDAVLRDMDNLDDYRRALEAQPDRRETR